ncbi:MAG: FxsA family protein, partial [Enterobacteriaceae bacterium]
MRWLPLLILFLLIYIEVALFVRVAEAVGVFLALMLVVLTSVLGAAIARRQGMVNLYVLRQKLLQGEDPADEIVRNVTLMLAGVLLF